MKDLDEAGVAPLSLPNALTEGGARAECQLPRHSERIQCLVDPRHSGPDQSLDRTAHKVRVDHPVCAYYAQVAFDRPSLESHDERGVERTSTNDSMESPGVTELQGSYLGRRLRLGLFEQKEQQIHGVRQDIEKLKIGRQQATS